jgi:hypothetical protein
MSEAVSLKSLARQVLQRGSERGRLPRHGEAASEAPRQSPRLNPGASPASGASAPPPSAADYDVTSTGPEGGCRVQIFELPAEGGRYRKTFALLLLKPPAFIPEGRWRQCIADARAFLRQWGDAAEALNWSPADLFELHKPPANPHPSYSRLSRYDAAGLLWVTEGRPVVALTESTAAIQTSTGSILAYRKHNKPGLGPLGDSLEDLK